MGGGSLRQLMVTPTFVFSVIIVTMAVLAFGTTQTYLRFSSAGPAGGCAVTGCTRPDASHSADTGPRGPAGAVPYGTAHATLPSPSANGHGLTHPSAKVRITYRTLLVEQWGFTATISITSRSARPVRQWTLDLRDPGVRITWMYGANGRPGARGTIIIEPEMSAEPLRRGQTLQVFFAATGPSGTPSGCVFDGLPCHVSQQS